MRASLAGQLAAHLHLGAVGAAFLDLVGQRQQGGGAVDRRAIVLVQQRSVAGHATPPRRRHRATTADSRAIPRWENPSRSVASTMSATCSWRSKKSMLRPTSSRRAPCRTISRSSGAPSPSSARNRASAIAMRCSADRGVPAPERPGQRGDRGLAHRRRRRQLLRDQAGRQTFAHALSRDLHLAGPQRLHQGQHDQPAADDGIGTVVVQAGHRRPPLRRAGGQQGHDLPHALAAEQIPVQAGDRVAAPPLIDLRQVPHGAAGAHQRRPRRQALQTRLRQRVLHVLHQPVLLSLRRGIGRQEGVGQAQGAQREAPGPAQAPGAEQTDLHAAAAHVELGAVLDRQPTHGAQEPGLRLLRPREDAQLDAQLLAHGLEQGGSVGGVAHRRGGHGHGAPRAAAHGDGAKVLQRLQRPLDRLGAEGLALQVADQPQRRPAAGQDGQVPVGLHVVHDHPSRVRSDVDDRDRARRPKSE